MDTRKQIFKYLNGEVELSELPVEAHHLARSIEERQKTIGRMLVKRGMIEGKPKTLADGTVIQVPKIEHYVHFLIARHVLGENRADTISVAPTGKMNLTETIARNPDLTQVQRLELGLIEDAAAAVPTGMGKALIDIGKFDFLKKVADNPLWTMPKSAIDVNGKKYSLGTLKIEVEAMKNTVKAMPDNVDVRRRYNELKTAYDNAITGLPDIKGYSIVPDVKTYGDLRGRLVRSEILDDIRPLWQISAAEKGDIARVIYEIEQQGMASFKTLKTAFNIPTATRNVISNFIQINMAGVPFHRLPDTVLSALKSALHKDKYFVLAKRHGLFKTNFAVAEIKEIINDFSAVERGKFSSFLKVMRKTAGYYGKIDDIAKLSLFKYGIEVKGMDEASATRWAQKWGMDYSLASRSVKEARRHVMPFLSYQYKIAPLIYETAKERPWVIAKYMLAPYLMAQATQLIEGLSPEEWEYEKSKLMPAIQKNESYMVIPHRSPEGQLGWVNLEYFFPWGNWLGIYRDIKNKEGLEFAHDVGVGNPFLDMYVGWKTNRDPYSGQEIVNRLDTPVDQYTDLANFLYMRFGPSMVSKYGATGQTISAFTGEKDRWGRSVDPAKAIGSWFGFNITYPSMQQTIATKKARVKELTDEYYRGYRELSQPGQDPDFTKRRKMQKRYGEIVQETLHGR